MEHEIIRLEHIDVSYDGEKVLSDLNLSIRDREFVTLLGPSGCGKTTTLRCIGGFTRPETGRVWFDGQDITDLPPDKRQVNTVFQRYALFPHLNVFDNIAFGLKLKKLPKDEIRQRVLQMLELVNLKGFDRRRIEQLSGGQQQRVAIARALINRPRVLLLDEPLGALDLKLRKEMQTELKMIQKQMGITFVYVTHDQEEALTMSDTVVVMNDGEIQQIGTPEDIYNEPKNAFVADFIGDNNIFDGIMRRDFLASFGGSDWDCVDRGFPADHPVDVVIRPEDVKVVPTQQGMVCGVVENTVFKGVHYEMTVEINGLHWVIQSTDCAPVGSTIGIQVDPNEIHIMEKLFSGDKNVCYGTITDAHTVSFFGGEVSFTRPDIDLPEGSRVRLTINPHDIEIVSADKSHAVGFLESVVYKGAYNECILYAYAIDAPIMIYSQNDEQVATDIPFRFDFDKIEVVPCDGEGQS